MGGIILLSSLAIPGSYLLSMERWTRTFGGSGIDDGYSVQQTSDGGFIIAGRTTSYGSGYYDVYLIKTDSIGDTLWTKTFGGSGFDTGYSIRQTSDNGYILAGFTESYGLGSADVYLIKTNAMGDTVWTRTFGGSGFDVGYYVQQTSDNGYIIIGYNGSYGPVGFNVYLIKTDSIGDTLWTRAVQGSIGYCIQQTSDGGYIITGENDSDVYIVKTDSLGNSLWAKTYGDSEYDCGRSVQQTTDNGYIITGLTRPPGGYESESSVYLIKTNALGGTLWTKKIGQVDGSSAGESVQQTNDGGYIITGSTYPYGITGSWGVYLIKTDSAGDTIWTRTFGGHSGDKGNSVHQTTDGGYIITGTIYQEGDPNIYLIKTDDNGNIMGLNEGGKGVQEIPKYFTLYQNYPNPFNSSTMICYELKKKAQDVELMIFSISGKAVRTLVRENQTTGSYEVMWDGKDEKGNVVVSGVYLYQLKLRGDALRKTKKMVLIQ